MPKFFIEKGNIHDDCIVINDGEFSHIIHVLRKKRGDLLTLCDGQGTDYACIISDIKEGCLTADILNRSLADTEPSLRCILFQAVPKGEKMDVIIQKAVELGVFAIVPVITKRCVVKLDQNARQKKTERWQKIAKEAAKQCGRGIIPQVFPVCDFVEAVACAEKIETKIILYECEKKNRMHDILTANMKQLAFFIGPEGGFEEDEVMLCIKNGITPASLGKRVLRTETASACLLSVAMFSTYNL